jgi:hypothetical protein
MAIFRDSLGNRYAFVTNGRKPSGGPKKTKSAFVPVKSSRRKSRKGTDKYERYRQKRGRPLGPGVPGNKSGKNKVTARARVRV